VSTERGKIGIVGAGSVGTTIGYACLIRGLARHLVLYDANKSKVEAESLDLAHGLRFVTNAGVEGSDDLNICWEAELIILAAGAKQGVNQGRMDLAANNVEIYRKMIPELIRIAPEAILLVVSNPVDVITYLVCKLSGLNPQRVLGSGTVLDSSRFRFLIARRCDVSIDDVRAYIAGEQGENEFPLWSTATIGNISLQDWRVPGRPTLSPDNREEIFETVKNSAERIILGKGAANYASGLATARIVEAILNDESLVLPVSSLLRDYRGIDDVCLSVPSIVNRRGVETALPVPMNAAEETGLNHSAQTAKSALTTLKV
jgi:L-lactate dehydrogenase